MASPILTLQLPHQANQRLPRSFSVDEYYAMAESGILKQGEHVELIHGQILTMSPIGSRHAACVNRINHIFAQALGHHVVISIQNPIRLDTYTEPEPDVALLHYRQDFYGEAHPRASDVLLIIEVADTTLDSDRAIKKPLYAEYSIPEFWIVALSEGHIEVYREPKDHAYTIQEHYTFGDQISIQAFPDTAFDVDQLLP